MTPVPADVQRVLSLLGNTHTQVANTLASKGIHGARRKAAHCPVSQFLGQEFPGVHFWTGTAFITWMPKGTGGIGFTELETPTPIRAFVKHYDGGEHPDLEAP